MTECTSPLAEAARDYVERGLAVIPLGVGKKEPVTKNGLNDWTDNPGQVDVWWGQGPHEGRRGNPRYNVGMACGQVSGGIIVIDLDCHSDEANGVEYLRDWEVEHGRLPETWTQITGSGGRQLFYRTGQDIRNSANGEIGVDVRGNGGYVVLPPSLHPCGEPYEWSVSPDDMDVADADDKVYDFIRAVSKAKKRPDGWNAGTTDIPSEITSNRNETLFSIGRSLLSRGMGRDRVALMIRSLNSTACKPPLPDPEVEKLIGSINSKEPGNPERDARRGGASAADVAELESRHGPLRGPRGGLSPNVLARMVMDRNMARIIDGAPAVWTGGRWEFGTHAIGRCCLDIADDARKADKSEVLSYIMDRAPHVSADGSFDGRFYVQFENCTFDVGAWREVEPGPHMYIANKIPVELDFQVGPNEADAFLEGVADGDADVMAALREVIGACMCSRRVLSQSPMLIGRAGGASGRASNGKSTYLNWLRQILGTENVSSLDIATLGQRFQAGRVVGKLANLGDDIPDGFLRGDELSIFKKLVTGDAIYTDVKNADGYEFRPTASMVFSMNTVPRLSDTTDGIFRRLAFIPFRRRFAPGLPGFDPDMASRLSKPDVLKRGALLGLLALGELVDRGGLLTPVPDMEVEMDEVRQDNDSVLRWLCDCGIAAEHLDGRVIADVYNEYRQWCEASGERNPFARRAWTIRVIEAVTQRHATTLGSVSKRPGNGLKTVRMFEISPV